MLSFRQSQTANEQADTTEEISSLIEQMTATINSNIKNAEQTGKIGTKSANSMQKGNSVFIETIKTVTKINEKISIFLEIANKTTLLNK